MLVLIQWLQSSKIAMWLLMVIRVYVGYKWLTAGWSKLTGGFDASGFMQGAIAKSTGEHPAVQDWWAVFLKHAALPGVKWFNVIIPLGEFLVGLGLILGTFTVFAALMGLVMNAAYLFSGSISINGQLLLLEFLIILSAANAGKIGLDRWLMPYLQDKFTRKAKISSDPSSLQNQAV
ncbi:hypothetical protein J14TS5_33700 [Paenibacillus lautus]|nr:hypothetical protein J14TS5_33700 [Paenibacillus lautus]